MATKVYLIPGVGFVQVPDSGTREYLIPGGGFFSEGSAAELNNYSLACESGSIAVTGTEVEFIVPANIKANSGSFTVSGTSVSLEYGRKLVATSGTVSITGTNVTLTPKYINKFDTDPSCVALWRFESGALTADSIGTNTLTNNGVAESTGSFKEGACAADFEYNDETDALTIADDDLDSGFPLKSGESNTQFSICFWMKPESILPLYVFSKGTTVNDTMSFAIICTYHVSSYVKPEIWIGRNGGEDISTWSDFTNFPAGQWYHISVIHDGEGKHTTFRLYRDSSGVATTYDYDWGTTTAITDSPVAIGNKCIPAAGNGFDGLLDEMVVFNRLISVDEADAIRQGSFVGSTYRLNVASGAFSVSGTNVGLEYNKLSVASGAYTITGNSLDFKVTRKISCTAGEVALSGTAVGFVLGKSVVASSGSFTLLGSIIGTKTDRVVDAASGEYSITGVDAGLIKGSHILIESDSFSISGTDVDLRPGKGIVLASGSITVTGKNVRLLYSIRDHVMSAESGTFVIHGKPITLKFSGGNPSTLALRINTKLAALSQYSNFNFHSVCYYNGVLLGANNGGIFRVDQEDDLGESINAFFEIFGADFNSNYRKFIRSSTISGVFDRIRVSVVADSTECPSHDSLYDATVEQKSVSIDMNKDDRGKYIGMKISNIDGSDFSIDGVSLVAGLVQKYSPSEAIVGRSKLNFSGASISAGGS